MNFLTKPFQILPDSYTQKAKDMVKLALRVFTGSFCIISFIGYMVTQRFTDANRTVVEELLISTAADLASKEIDLSGLTDKKVFLDASGFVGTVGVGTNTPYADTQYAIGLISTLLGTYGASIVDDKKASEATVAITSGAFSIDRSDSLVGIPARGIPIPLAGTMQTPEIAFYKTIRQTGVAKFAINAYEISTGKQLLALYP